MLSKSLLCLQMVKTLCASVRLIEMVPFYCAICKRTDFSGKSHIYGKSHQSKLKVVLVKFLEKVKTARRTVRKPQVVKWDAAEHGSAFWCYCCEREVERHTSDGAVTVLHGGLLEHISTREHRTKTHTFWWNNKADPKLKEKFIMTKEELERFKVVVAKALDEYVEKEDMLIEEQAAVIRSQEQCRLELLHSLTEVCFPEVKQHQPDPELHISAKPDQQNTEQMTCKSSDISKSFGVCLNGLVEQPGPSHEDVVLHSQCTEPGRGLTFIGYQDSSGSGNVHTGAMPPWLLDEPEEVSIGPSSQIGPSLEEYLKHKEQEKLKKLPPNRVGANFDHSSHTNANWLPSFGRVWNSGRRWQSRNQFRAEEDRGRQKRKREHGVDKATKT